MINLATFFTSLGITGGNTQATNFYDFWKGIIMNGNTEINNITEFMTYLGTNRYEFFKSLNSDYPEVIDETSFYSNIDDPRIYDFKTFYTYAGEYFGGTPVTPTPTPTNTPTPTPTPITPTPTPITPTPTPTPSSTPSVISGTTAYTTSGSYTFYAPTGASEATVEVWGAGGGGGNSDNTSVNGGQGGGGGGYSMSNIYLSYNRPYYLYVGLGGLGAPMSSTNPALDGEMSWYNLDVNLPPTGYTQGILANGGKLGLDNTNFQSFSNPPYYQIPNGATLTDAFGAVKYSGGSGGYGSAFYGLGGGSSAGVSAHGTDSIPTFVIEAQPGAIAPTGGGNGGNGGYNSGTNGTNGLNPGGGGGGADDRATSFGGNGADGKVQITYSSNNNYQPFVEFILAATGSTIPGPGEIVFDNANACYDPRQTVMRISYTDRFGVNMKSVIDTYTGATGVSSVLDRQQFVSNSPQFYYYVISYTEYPTYLEITHNIGTGTCGSGLWEIGAITALRVRTF